jgi:hypothetical protein
MVLTKGELIGSLQHEVRILLHLASKIDRSRLDYRPSPKQRSTLELLRYLTVMGPELTRYIKAGTFDVPAWTAAEQAAAALDFDQVLAAIAAQPETYATLLADLPDDDLRVDVTMFGSTMTRGAYLVNLVLCGYAAYRTQLFLYLKACGRDDLSTINLWGGRDATPAATTA